MKNASYPKYKPNVQALGPAATKPAVGLAASDRCQVPAPAGTTPPQAERPTPSAGRAGRVPIEGLGQKLSGWTGGWETAGDGGKRKAFRRLLRWGQRTWNLKGKPAESEFSHPQLLGMLLRKRSSSSKSGNSCIFQCLHFQPADICRTLICAPGTRAACHMDIQVPSTRTSRWVAILFY